MNKWIAISVAIILTAGVVINGVLYIQESGKLEDARSQISALEGNYDALQGDFTLLDNSFSALEGDLSTIQDDVSSLEGNVSSVQDDVSSLEGNVSSLSGDVSSLEGNVSSLEGDVSTLEDSVYNLDDKVFSVEGSLSMLEGDFSSLEGDVASVQDDVLALEAHDRAVMDAVAMVAPSVVRIITDLGSGSGVIITNDGWVLTNKHVLEDAAWAEITTMDGATYGGGSSWWSSISFDLALVKMDTDYTDFPAAILGSSADITVGEQVVAIGFPFWPEISDQPTVTTGIVSAVQAFSYPELTELFGEGLWVQTDTAINYGNSGGPMVNLKGEVIAINTLSVKFWDDALWQGLNFSIPIDDAKPFIESVTS